MLIDTSASYWPQKGASESLADGTVPTAANALVSAFDTGGTRLVSLGTFDGSSATVRWQLADASLPEATGSTLSVQHEENAARVCLATIVESADQAEPQVPGTDVMGALDSAGTELGATPPARSHVLVITDGLSNTGCLNLNTVLREGESAADIIRSCGQLSGLPRLSGAQLSLVGIGFQALYAPMSTYEQNWLEDYWRDLCAALQVRSPQSCIGTQTRDSVRASAVSRPNDPKISFPEVTRADIVVPAPLLFAFNSAVLTAGAKSYLDILIQEIKSKGHSITKVIGHTDRVGSASYNLALSRRRAQAVRAYLAANGFAGITAVGVGFSDPACPNEYTSSGRPNQPCMARDRRVDIMLGGRNG